MFKTIKNRLKYNLSIFEYIIIIVDDNDDGSLYENCSGLHTRTIIIEYDSETRESQFQLLQKGPIVVPLNQFVIISIA